MNVNEVSRLMNIYMLNTMMKSGITSSESSGVESTGVSSLGSSGLGSNNSDLFEYLLQSALNNGNSTSSCGCNCCSSSYNGQSLSNNINNTYNTLDKVVSDSSKSSTASAIPSTNTSSSTSGEVYGVYGDFYPMGKAPKLSSKDINISPRIDDAIKEASKKYGVEESFVRAIIKQESSFNPNTKSGAGAMGLMQLMSYNATDYGVKNPYNIEQNVNGGVNYIKDLLDKFNGNKQLALSAYNGGITRMSKRGVDTVPEIVNMPRETRDYVSKVMGYYNQYKQVQNI
ncbi:lytic transglycosylase domain-containing protein [Clostridium cylindrosporum]|uniref:Putative murein lytic transglycosylase YjbJ n=1 Tax=Clostridium cylindrosporum DSM 605 TaxID=1121307 RepID=A0A0J8DBP6_CLOCY|nr:lytic transglycosylase domain-containing protein [Clostridium cylindrosporum]KMT23277.1 putative murein lytic transglycosylase YjbJ [Clostridium cylindrosporum DSM 605]